MQIDFSDPVFWIDLLGWAGAISVLVAYGLISAKKLSGESIYYQILNFIGALFLILNTIYKEAYPSAFVNVIWALIAFWALFRYTIKKKY
jgi:hypothetical protein